MFAACWSAKGGSGTTVVAASLALVLARRADAARCWSIWPATRPRCSGCPSPPVSGLADWLAAGADGADRRPRSSRGGRRLRRLALLPRGRGRARTGRAGRGAGRLAGVGEPIGGGRLRRAPMVGRRCRRRGARCWRPPATDSLFVTRACYLSLRRLVAAPAATVRGGAGHRGGPGPRSSRRRRRRRRPRGGRGGGRCCRRTGRRRRPAGRPPAPWSRAGAGAGDVNAELAIDAVGDVVSVEQIAERVHRRLLAEGVPAARPHEVPGAHVATTGRDDDAIAAWVGTLVRDEAPLLDRRRGGRGGPARPGPGRRARPARAVPGRSRGDRRHGQRRGQVWIDAGGPLQPTGVQLDERDDAPPHRAGAGPARPSRRPGQPDRRRPVGRRFTGPRGGSPPGRRRALPHDPALRCPAHPARRRSRPPG